MSSPLRIEGQLNKKKEIFVSNIQQPAWDNTPANILRTKGNNCPKEIR